MRGATEAAIEGTRAGRQSLRPRVGSFAVATCALLLVCAGGILVGKAAVDPGTVVAILASRLGLSQATPWWPASLESIVWEIRLPRVVLAGMVGAGLSVAG